MKTDTENERHIKSINVILRAEDPAFMPSPVNTKALAKPQVSLHWIDGDRISVVNLTSGNALAGELVASVSSGRAIFAGQLTGDVNMGDHLVAIYPSQSFESVEPIDKVSVDLSSQHCSSVNDVEFVAYSLFQCQNDGELEVDTQFTLPVSYSQIAVTGLDPGVKVDFVELSNVGNAVSLIFDSSKNTVNCTSSVGVIRITPSNLSSRENGGFFAYCAHSDSPAISRELRVKAGAYLYTADWAAAAMSSSKYYASLAYCNVKKQYEDGNGTVIEFKDEVLNRYMLASFDEDEDGTISQEEAEYVQVVNCAGKGVSDLSGLESCKNLRYLNFSANNVRSVCLSDMPKLETLIGYDNPIEVLKIDNDLLLSSLYIVDDEHNSVVQDSLVLDGLSCAAALELSFVGCGLTSIRLSGSKTLESIDLSSNRQLKYIDLNGNSKLISFNCETLAALQYLDLSNCAITDLDLTNNVYLEYLNCSQNYLTNLSIAQNAELVHLICSENQLQNIKVSNNKLLETLDIHGNSIEVLNLRNNSSLTELDASLNTGITSIDFSSNPGLQIVKVSKTAICDLDFVNNPNLVLVQADSCAALNSIRFNWSDTLMNKCSLTTNRVVRILSSDNAVVEDCFSYHNSDPGFLVGDDIMYVCRHSFSDELRNIDAALSYYESTRFNGELHRLPSEDEMKLISDHREALSGVGVVFDDEKNYWTSHKYYQSGYYKVGSSTYHQCYYIYSVCYNFGTNQLTTYSTYTSGIALNPWEYDGPSTTSNDFGVYNLK